MTRQYRVEALSIQIGATEDERRFVWLQHPDFPGARVRLAALADYERDGGFTEENSRTVIGTTAPVRREEPYLSCKVRVPGLVGGTEYVYSVGCDAALDEATYRFSLPKDPKRELSFFLISDLHINVYRRPINQWDPDGTRMLARYESSLARASAFDGKPAFFLSIGDNTSVANMGASMFPEPEKYSKLLSAQISFAEHLEFLSVPTAKSLPFATIQGNHDAVALSFGAETVGDGNNVLYDMPNDDGYAGHYLDSVDGGFGPADVSSGDFWFRSGDLLVVGINAMVNAIDNRTPCAPEVHRAFIEGAIAACPDTRWRILLCHVPAYAYVEGSPRRTHSGEIGAPTEPAKMASFFGGLCDPFGFDLVFTGHQHAFSRTYPLLDGRVVGEDARTVERCEGGAVTETLLNPHGVIHYNVPSLLDHAFFANLPLEPEALYPAYGVTENALRGGREAGIPNAEKFRGVTYRSPTYTHVRLEATETGSTMTVSSVRSDTNEAFDTLIISKAYPL